MSDGAFVDIDVHRLSREGLVMLGMKEALDKWIDTLMSKAHDQPNQGVARVMVELAGFMAQDRDAVAVELTKKAVTDKSGTINHIRKD